MIEQPDVTLCRCGVQLAFCADCRGWLAENSARIADAIEWWHIRTVEHGLDPGPVWGADAAEADDLAYFECGR
jgi:hypothetical protein